MRDSRPGHVEITIEVGLQGLIEVLVGQILEAVDMLLEGRVVDEDIELAKLVQGFLDRVASERRIGDIA